MKGAGGRRIVRVLVREWTETPLIWSGTMCSLLKGRKGGDVKKHLSGWQG